MARIHTITHIEAPPQQVWDRLADWEGQAAWMVDANSVTVLSPVRTGPGVTIRAMTRIAGVVLRDDMEVTDWREPEVVAVRHLGPLIRGVGAWELRATPHGTQLTWWEELDLPLGPVGELVGNAVVVPWVDRQFRASLAGLKRLCESTSVRP